MPYSTTATAIPYLDQAAFEQLKYLAETYEDYTAQRDEVVAANGFDTRKKWHGFCGIKADYDRLSCSALASGPRHMAYQWQCMDFALAEEILPNPLRQTYYQHIGPMVGYSEMFYSHLEDVSQRWLGTIQAPTNFSGYTLEEKTLYLQILSDRFDAIADPQGMIKTLAHQANPQVENSPSVIVRPITYPVALSMRNESDLYDMSRFLSKIGTNQASYAPSLDTIHMHCHQILLAPDLLAFLDTKTRKQENMSHYHLRNFLANRENFVFTDAGTLYRNHALAYHNKTVGLLWHEKIHQHHTRCDEAFHHDPDTIEKMTGYNAADEFITALSVMAHRLTFHDPSYSRNCIEIVVDRTISHCTNRFSSAKEFAIH